jgi:type III restriction enzyme
LLIIRQTGSTFSFDILEPHNPSLADNFEKAIGLAEFAEKHGHLFDRIQLIRKKSFGSGGDHFVRLGINSQLIQKKLRLITSNPQLDLLFAEEAV